jgi:hypothetical protein
MTPVTDQISFVLAAKADALVRRAADDLAALIHPDFVYINATGRRFDKAGYLDAYCVSGNVVFLEQAVSELQVTPFDGFAVATFLVDDRFSAGGRIVTGEYRSLCVFSAANNGFLWASGQTMTRG